MNRSLSVILSVLFLACIPKPLISQDAGGGGAEAQEVSKSIKPLPTAKKRALKNQMRRLYQNGKLDKLRAVVEDAFKVSHPEADKDVLAFAAFYRAGFKGKENDWDGCMEWIEKAIGYGYLSADGFEGMDMIPAAFKYSQKDTRFLDRMKKLRQEAEVIIWSEYTTGVKEAITKTPETTVELSGIQEIQAEGCQPVAPETLKGKPICLVISPILHDGFTKEAPILERMAQIYKGKVEPVVLFYQYYRDDEARKGLAKKYIKELNWKVPIRVGIVARDFVKPLEIPFYPCHLFLAPKGTLVYRQDGFMREKEIDFVLGEIAKLAPPPPPPPPPAPEPKKEETPKAEPKKEEAPAEEPKPEPEPEPENVEAEKSEK